MVTEFYKTNDCINNTNGENAVMSAEVQLAKAEDYRDAAKITYWNSVKSAMISSINQLWRLGHVTFWEEDWFPGHEVFIEDIKALGYVVVSGSARRNECGLTQDYYRITLPTIKPENKDLL